MRPLGQAALPADPMGVLNNVPNGRPQANPHPQMSNRDRRRSAAVHPSQHRGEYTGTSGNLRSAKRPT